MHKNTVNIIERFLKEKINQKILILHDKYYSENSFEVNSEIKDLKTHFKTKKINFDLVTNIDDFLTKQDSYDCIINIHFSSYFFDQIFFINKILDLSKISSTFINILPFGGYVNFGMYNFNPLYFVAINVNNNFKYDYFSFVDNFGNHLTVENKFLSKVFLQTTPKKNQNFIDTLYKITQSKMLDTSIFCAASILHLKKITSMHFIPTRLPHHLSGHSGITWVDNGALDAIIKNKKIKSFLDIGCGPGGMVLLADSLGIRANGIDGDNSILRQKESLFYIHDYTKGEFIPDTIYDLAWSVEFLEHVEEKFQKNYFSTFKKCKYIFITFAPENKSGFHHVNTKNERYWIDTFKKFNFEFDYEITKKIRSSSSIKKNFIKDFGLFFKNNKI